MKLFKISQTVNNDYDTYYAAVVAALSEEQARRMHPEEYIVWSDALKRWVRRDRMDEVFSNTWAKDIADVQVSYIGEAANDQQGIILASFNAG